MTHVELIAAFFSTYEREGSTGVIARYDDFFTPDNQWTPPISEIGAPYVGRGGYERYWREVEEGFEELGFADLEYKEIAPDAVLTRMHVQARGRESGVELDEACILICWFRAGRVCWGRAWYDLEAAERAADAIARGDEVPA